MCISLMSLFVIINMFILNITYVKMRELHVIPWTRTVLWVGESCFCGLPSPALMCLTELLSVRRFSQGCYLAGSIFSVLGTLFAAQVQHYLTSSMFIM